MAALSDLSVCRQAGRPVGKGRHEGIERESKGRGRREGWNFGIAEKKVAYLKGRALMGDAASLNHDDANCFPFSF